MTKELDAELVESIPIIQGVPDRVGFKGGEVAQQTKTTYNTAVRVQQPRDLATIETRVLKEAAMAGSSFYYCWDVVDKRTQRKIEVLGPSIDMAMALARNYMNCAIEVDHYESATHFIFKGTFIDLETGFTVPRLYRQRKKQSMGEKMEADRAEDIVFQIGQSKAQRNAIIKAMPSWLVDKMIEAAKAAERRQVVDLPKEITKAITFFTRAGATIERMEMALEKNSKDWNIDDIVKLKGMATALKENRATIEELFPSPVAPEEEKPTPMYEAAQGPTPGATTEEKPKEIPNALHTPPPPPPEEKPKKAKSSKAAAPAAGLLTAEHRQEIINLCEKYSLDYKHIADRIDLPLDKTPDGFFMAIMKLIEDTVLEEHLASTR